MVSMTTGSWNPTQPKRTGTKSAHLISWPIYSRDSFMAGEGPPCVELVETNAPAWESESKASKSHQTNASIYIYIHTYIHTYIYIYILVRVCLKLISYIRLKLNWGLQFPFGGAWGRTRKHQNLVTHTAHVKSCSTDFCHALPAPLVPLMSIDHVVSKLLYASNVYVHIHANK